MDQARIESLVIQNLTCNFAEIVSELVVLVILDICHGSDQVARQAKDVGQQILTNLADCRQDILVRKHPVADNQSVGPKIALI